MKSMEIVKALGCIAAVLFTLNAYAADSGTSETPSTAAAPSTKALNRALARKVHGALSKKKGLDPTHIYVKAVGGAITLTGSAVNQAQIDLATEAAQNVEGVTSVTNKISVRAPS
ncbi:BON domain-containing protein [Caballeronia sp. LjRoot31]|uniref:BON domain-containing protein n=1 Tax=Caballeronia sp. LjRoot31 TaxID=3342324 RepID=UPI003ECC5B63